MEMTKEFLLLSLIISSIVISCGSKEEKNKELETEIELETEVATNETIDMSADINLEINFDNQEVGNGVFFSGITNLPEGTVLGISLKQEKTKFYASDFRIKVSNGRYISSKFSNRGRALDGKYEAELVCYFTKKWQPERLLTDLDRYIGEIIFEKEDESDGKFKMFEISKTLSFNVNPKEQTKKDYSIINEELSLPHKASYNVRIFEKLSESKLQKISKEIQNESQQASRVYITFYLPGMKVDAGAWATAHKGEDVRVMEFMLNSNPTTLKD